MCVRAYVRLCVCQGFVRQISPACAALVLLNQASITRPLWIMQGRLLLTYSTGCSCWCVLSVRVRVTGRSFFLLANATGQFFDVPPLGPLNLVSDTGTPTLILVFLSVCVCVRASAYAGGFFSRREELNSSRQLRPALWHTLTHYIQPAHSGILSLKKTIRYEVKGASLAHMEAQRRKYRWTHSPSYPQVYEAEILIIMMLQSN